MSIENKIKNIFEAPIPWDEIPRGTGHYLGGKDDPIMRKRLIMGEINKIKDELKKMSWKKIAWTNSGNSYYPQLPTSIINMINNLINGRNSIYQSQVALANLPEFKQAVIDFLKANISTGSYNFRGIVGLGSNTIYMQIDSSNRTHFPNDGINPNLRNTGLGKKLYRGLIEQAPAGWVTTNSGGTEVKNWMWAALTHEQYDENGRRDKDAEIYSFRFGNALYAISTTKPVDQILRNGYTVINKISDKSTLRNKETRLANNIGIDGDFVALCKRNKTNTHAAQVLSWVNVNPRQAAQLQREEEKRRKEELKRKNALLKSRLKAYCGVSKIEDLSSDFQEGDWIVVKSYLLQHDYTGLPIRKATKVGNTWKAYKPSNPTGDVRETTNKTDWVKALAPAIGSDYPPGTNGVPATTSRRRSSSPRGPRTATTTATTAATTPAPTPAPAPATTYRSITDIQNTMFTTDAAASQTYSYDNATRRRFRIAYFNDNSFIYVPKDYKISSSYKMGNYPIFGYAITSANAILNTKTMEAIPASHDRSAEIANAIKQYSFKYKLVTVEKRDLNANDLVLITQHSKFFGYVAKVLSTSLTTRGDKYIYLRVPGAGRNNRLTLTPQSIKKLVLVAPDTNESKNNINENMFNAPNFEKYLKMVRESITVNDTGMMSSEDAFNKIVNYCDELIGADLLPYRSAQRLSKQLDLFKDAKPNTLKNLLNEFDGADILPYDNNGMLEEPEEILELFDEYNL